MFLIEFRLLLVNLRQGQENAVIEAVENVVNRQSVPASHDAHVDDEGDRRDDQLVPGEALSDQTHRHAGEDEVAEPVGQGDVPAVPELLDVLADKGLVEVLRGVDAEDLRYADGHAAVARKIEEEVETIAVHVNHGRCKA